MCPYCGRAKLYGATSRAGHPSRPTARNRAEGVGIEGKGCREEGSKRRGVPAGRTACHFPLWGSLPSYPAATGGRCASPAKSEVLPPAWRRPRPGRSSSSGRPKTRARARSTPRLVAPVRYGSVARGRSSLASGDCTRRSPLAMIDSCAGGRGRSGKPRTGWPGPKTTSLAPRRERVRGTLDAALETGPAAQRYLALRASEQRGRGGG